MTIGEVQPFTQVKGPSAWIAADYTGSTDAWILEFSPAEIAEIEGAVKSVQAVGIPVEDIRAKDFPVPSLASRLGELLDDILTGRGFVLLRGLPVEQWSLEQSTIAYWGLCSYFGELLPQNKFGHLIGHVKDHGQDPNAPTTRIYATAAAQPYHVDRAADIVGLLCLKNAKEGGLSSWSSSMTVHNEILRTRPDLAKVLAEPFYTDRKGEIPAGKQPYYQMPVFNYHDGLLTVNYSQDFINSCYRNFPEVGPMSPQQREALDLMEALAADDRFRLDFRLEPGDIQLICNHKILHSRSAFVDFAEPEKKRHLLRMWICPPNGRPLPKVFEEQYGSVEIGRRGGIRVPGVKPTVDMRGDR